MAVTTTATIRAPKGPRCDRCRKLARGGVVVLDANRRQLGVCCAGPRDREVLEGMIGDAPEEPVEDQVIAGHDPLSDAPGAHPGIFPLIKAVRKLNWERYKAGLPETAGVTSGTVREAEEKGLLKRA